ncbi:class I SAM-dependent methyltransferase [Streptomyces sp. MN03-5084-2B]|nr:class I SAM-dependent methyltransferase [Streptomyces sp. MN03-5084-2B]
MTRNITPADAVADGFAEGPVGGAARTFNSIVAGFSIATAWEVGALDELKVSGELAVGEFCVKHDLHEQSVHGMFAALASVGVVERAGEIVKPGPEFTDVYRAKGFFHWLTIGCAELFANMPNVVRNENRRGDFYRRNAVAISYACRDINMQAFDPIFWRAMESLDFDFTKIADLGCGGAGRLTQVADRFSGVKGVGVDISAAALGDAAKNMNAAGFGGQFDFVQADVRKIGPDPRFADVEVLTCFMMGHDFWPREDCVASLRRIREAFPNVRRFLLGDTARTAGVADRDKEVFTLGFETAHDLMGVYLPTLTEWSDVFEESGWRCVNAWEVAVPADSFIYELA